MNNLPTLLDHIIRIAEQAGQVILEQVRQGFTVEKKSDGTPITSADMVSHDVIKAELAKLTPVYPLLSEEEEELPFSERAHWHHYWLVDPLDGTKEFVRHSEHYSVNIALIHEHESILGVIHLPAWQQTYFAARGHGAYKHRVGEPAESIHTRAIPSMPTVACGRWLGNKRLAAFRERLPKHELKMVGSSIKSCLVADGQVDIYPGFGPTMEWDTAAAQCIIEEAGGVMLSANQTPLRYNEKAELRNPFFIATGDPELPWLPDFIELAKDDS